MSPLCFLLCPSSCAAMSDESCNPENNLPPCHIPIVPPGLPSFEVTPCPPTCNPCAPQSTPPCAQPVCVPLVRPEICPPCEPVRRKCKYIQPARPKSYKPEIMYQPPCLPMEENTTYRKSYLPVEGERVGQIIPENNLCVGTGPFSKDTVNKMSYLPHKALPPCPILPCEHKLIGEGPMQDITTNRHDYTPKPYSKVDAIVANQNLFTSDCPLSDKTVNRLSYMPFDPNKLEPVLPIKPINAIQIPDGKFADKTVQKMSYQPWEPQCPIETPWALKQPYQPPKLRMEDNTVHKMSYGPPGTYIECADNDPDCVDCPYECDPNNKNPQCCQPCCCPRAAC